MAGRSVRSALPPVAVWLGLAAGVLAAPAACLFPSYTFDGTGAGTGAGGGTHTSSSGAGGGMSSTSSSSTSSTSSTGSTSSSSGTSSSSSTSSSSTTSSTSSSSTSSTSSSSSTSTGGVPETDCFDGLDNNGNGLVDCADLSCSSVVECVPDVPTADGWDGPFALYDGAPSDPGCPNAYPSPAYVGNDNLMASPATCAACFCGVASGEKCVPPAELTIGDASCKQQDYCTGTLSLPSVAGAGCVVDSVPIDGGTAYYGFPGGRTTCGPGANATCDKPTGTQCNQSVSAPAPTVAGGQCAASGGAASKPPVTWSTLARACGGPVTTAGGCNIGQRCLPKAPPVYSAGICISKPGDNACPAGAFANNKHLFYGSHDDNRDCTACGCDAPTGGTCSVTITIFQDTNCTVPAGTFAAGNCTGLNGNLPIYSREVGISGVVGGKCTASATGGQPTGAAAPTAPTTFCCVP